MKRRREGAEERLIKMWEGLEREGRGVEDVTITHPLARDVRAITELLHTTWLATYPNPNAGISVDGINDIFKMRTSQKGLARETLRILRPPSGQTNLIAKDSGRTVGFCRVQAYPGVNELQELYVLPQYQGRGVGSLLWKEARDHLHLQFATLVRVVSYNTTAIAFYQKNGFKDTGARSTMGWRTASNDVQFPITEMTMWDNGLGATSRT